MWKQRGEGKKKGLWGKAGFGRGFDGKKKMRIIILSMT